MSFPSLFSGVPPITEHDRLAVFNDLKRVNIT